MYSTSQTFPYDPLIMDISLKSGIHLLHLTCMWNMFYCTDIVLQLFCCYLSSILKINLRETTVREIFKTQKSRDKLEAKKRRQKQQRTNKNRKKTHRKLKVNEQPGLHHTMGAWTRCTGRALDKDKAFHKINNKL